MPINWDMPPINWERNDEYFNDEQEARKDPETIAVRKQRDKCYNKCPTPWPTPLPMRRHTAGSLRVGSAPAGHNNEPPFNAEKYAEKSRMMRACYKKCVKEFPYTKAELGVHGKLNTEGGRRYGKVTRRNKKNSNKKRRSTRRN